VTARAVLDRARGRHERVTGREWSDADTAYVDTRVAILPSGTPCRLKSPTTAASTVAAGDQAIVQRIYELDLSWDAKPVLDGVEVGLDVEDIVTLESSDDAWAVGRPLTLIAVGLSGSTSCRRVVVQDQTGAAPPPETVAP
jgi:hypothetical protein